MHMPFVMSYAVRILLLWVRDSERTINKAHLIIIFYIYRTLLVIQPLWRFEVRRRSYIVVSGKIETHVSNFFNYPTGSLVRVDFDQRIQSGYSLLDVVHSIDVIELDDRT